MAARSSELILEEFDKFLSENPWKGPPSDLSHLTNPDYFEYFSKLSSHEEVISRAIVERAQKLISGGFHICCVDCGEGKFAWQVLKELGEKNPSVSFHFTGVEEHEEMCEAAEESMKGLPTNVTSKIIVGDPLSLSTDDVTMFDLIIMVNSVYHTPPLDPLIAATVKFLKPGGEFLIVSTPKQSFMELVTRLWKHERKHELCTSELVTSSLKSLNLSYETVVKKVTFDLSECFLEKFSSPVSQIVLDQFTLARLSDYAPQVSELAIEYLECIAEGKPPSSLICSKCDIIIVGCI